jgi:glycosyltransferase involved in cell wall biosynthesis
MKIEQRPAICIVRHNYYPDSHVRRDAEALTRAGYAVHVVALRRRGQAPREEIGGVTVHRLPVEHRRGNALRYAREYGSFAIRALFKVAALQRKLGFHAVEVDNMPDLLVFSALVPKLLGVPIHLYIFDNMPELFAHIKGVSSQHPVVRLLAAAERISATFADRVIVTQGAARRAVIGRGVAPDKVSVVLNSADEAIFRPRPIQPARQADDPFEIVTHGVLLQRYGVHILIDALPQIAAALPNVRCQIFGEGEYRAALEARARERGVADRVVFRGFAPQGELLDALARADVGYVGMLCDLMLSNKLVEYVTVGVPAVVARWPTFEEYFPEGTVSYFPPGDADALADAIIALAHDPARARQQAANATAHNAQYRWAVQQQAYLGIYDAVRPRTVIPHTSEAAD